MLSTVRIARSRVRKVQRIGVPTWYGSVLLGARIKRGAYALPGRDSRPGISAYRMTIAEIHKL